MSKGDIATYPVDITYSYRISKIYFLLKGSYENSQAKSFDVNLIYIYNMQEKIIQIPVSAREELIREYFRVLANVHENTQ